MSELMCGLCWLACAYVHIYECMHLFTHERGKEIDD
jgi:hypothetical protein